MEAIKVNFTLPDTLLAELNSFSQEMHQKKSHIVARALEMYFDHMDIALAEKRIQEYESGDDTVHDIDDIIVELTT